MNISLLAILAVVTFISAFIQGSLGIGFALIVVPVVGMLKPDLLPFTHRERVISCPALRVRAVARGPADRKKAPQSKRLSPSSGNGDGVRERLHSLTYVDQDACSLSPDDENAARGPTVPNRQYGPR